MSKDTAHEEKPGLEREAKLRHTVSPINIKALPESEAVSGKEIDRESRFALTPLATEPLAKNEAEGRQEKEQENPWLGDQIPEEKDSQQQIDEETLKPEAHEPDLT